MSELAQPTAGVRDLSARLAVVAVVVILTLIGVCVSRYPESIQPPGNRWLKIDIAFLLIYASAAIWVTFQRSASVKSAIRVGSVAGLLFGGALVANHVTELFVPVRNFALVIAPVLLALLLFGATGSAARERTGSFVRAGIAGVWSALTGVLILITVALVMDIVFQERAELQLKEPFAASGMRNPGAYLTRNSLQAASEGLLRIPVFALFLSLTGALADAILKLAPRRALRMVAGIVFLVFVVGLAALWYANLLERPARPPFVMSGVLLVAMALCAARPIWSSLRRKPS